ncbi:MAG TPA: sugar transferase [Acidobacteriaceae bacterium]|jgi:lipopolysaccharide/colanic/teichoic acid biosynthesis glycosyltransferase|nr:sugar transferase [Acidobacteriaceae bacterium]
MSSLSFDNVFPAESGQRSDSVPHYPSAAEAPRPSASWSHRLPALIAQKRTASDASPWALSSTRRALDAFFAVVALLTFLPLMAFAALLVRLGSPGPVFFRQKRMGRNGSEFTLYKFRSMSTGCGNHNGSCITVTGDTRITPVGALLRRYKLDELPQFWNVLRGDMCLVGPRPKLPHHEALHMDCRPGITGAATLAFRNEEDFLSEIPEDQLEGFYEMFVKPTKARLDLEYMRTASLAGDLRILWRTVTACLFSADDALAISAETVAQFEATRAIRRFCPPPPVPQRKAPRSTGHEFQPELEFSRNSASSTPIS